MVTLIFTAFFALVVAISALVGLVRGLNKSVIRLMTLIPAILITILIATPVTQLICRSILIEGITLGELILGELLRAGGLGGLLPSMELLQKIILVLPAFAIGLVVFPVVFTLLRFITWIVFLFVQKPLRKLIFKDTGDKAAEAATPTGIRVAKRFGGMGVGIVTGVLVFAMLMTPFFGLISMLPSTNSVDALLDTMVQQNMLDDANADMIREAYGSTDAGVIRLYKLVGLGHAGKAYINSVTSFEYEGKTVYLFDELGAVMNIAQTALDGGALDILMNADDPNAIFTMLSDKGFLDNLMNSAFQSKLLTNMLPDLVASAVEGVATGMNVPANKEAVYNNMMDDIAQKVQTADIDYAAIKAYEDANGIAYRFARTGTSGKASTREGLMTEDEYLAEVQKVVDLTKVISSILNKSLSGNNPEFTDGVAAQIVNQVKTQVAENGQDAVANFDANGVQNAITNIQPEDLEVGNGELLGQLSDPEKFETDVPTAEVISNAIRESVGNAFADEEKAAETATALAGVVSDLVGAVASATDENGEIDLTKIDFGKIGNAVTTLQNSELKGLGSSVLDLVASSDLGDNPLVGDMIGAVKEGYENGEDVGGTIGTAGALIGLGTAMGGGDEANPDAVVDSLVSLINNLNDFTISLLPSILSTDTITSLGVPAEFADATFTVVETLLKELMKLKGAENYDHEVNTILYFYNIATTGVENFTEEDIPELVNAAINSDAIYNTLISISTSNPFGIEIPDDGTRDSLIQGLEDHYAKSGKTDRELAMYTAVATLLGLENEVHFK